MKRILCLVTAALLLSSSVFVCYATSYVYNSEIITYEQYQELLDNGYTYVNDGDVQVRSPLSRLRYEQFSALGEFQSLHLGVQFEDYTDGIIEPAIDYYCVRDANDASITVYPGISARVFSSYNNPNVLTITLDDLDSSIEHLTQIADLGVCCVEINSALYYYVDGNIEGIVVPYADGTIQVTIDISCHYPMEGEDTLAKRLMISSEAYDAVSVLRAQLEGSIYLSDSVIMWIVVGGILVVAVVICAILLWRRKKKKAASVVASDAEAIDAGAESPSDAMEADGVSLSEDTATDTPKDSGGA